MNLSITFDDFNQDLLEQIRQAARREGWTGTAGLKDWARQTYHSVLRTNRHGDWTSISFKTQDDFGKFHQDFNIKIPGTPETAPVLDVLGRPVSDKLLREIHKDDYVVFHNNIYQVLDVIGGGYGLLLMIMLNKSPSTKPVKKYAQECCIVDRDAVLMWLLAKPHS